MNNEEPLRQDQLDRWWKHIEDEIDMEEAMDLLESLPIDPVSKKATESILLTPSQIDIVARGVALAVSEILYRQSQRKPI